MTPLFALLQATSVEPLPEEAAATVSELAADPNVAAGAEAAGNHLDIVQLLLHASIPVQFVMLLLLVASIASWVIIFRKRSLLNRAEDEADRFEERFWSGADRSEEHTFELQSLMRISYAGFCLKNKTLRDRQNKTRT